jgi:uncharacterized membrane protein
MIPLVVLLTAFAVLFGANRFLLHKRLELSFIGRAALAVTLIVTGSAHFTSTDVMVEMMPEFMPWKRETVYLTGVIEFLAVIGLLVNRLSRLTAVLLIIFFVAILPANIVGSLKQLNFGGMENGAIYLLFRIPLQILFIFWAYYFGIRKNEQRVTRLS